MTAPLLTITVKGDPITQGSKTRTRNGGMRETNAAKLKPWRERVTDAARDQLVAGQIGGVDIHRPPLKGPVRVEITFTLAARATKTRPAWPFKQRSGDVDKLTRAIFDSLTDAGVWLDDAQVVEVTARKVYPEHHRDALAVPGALIRIWPMNGDA
ncbi:RusA family crossover junction endodeoxyribonuclease [Streptomyces albidoflavus]|uniref:RusA family crossover junction endodeoxyribonuclease n=1 Tax=Streptomyces albidoflavus TaxID=1886 RepID=UPI00331C0256